MNIADILDSDDDDRKPDPKADEYMHFAEALTYDDADQGELPPGTILCRVPGCARAAKHEVLLYDFYRHNADVFWERDYTCPFICAMHALENEAKIRGERRPRSGPIYPYTNRHAAQGFTIYRPLNLENEQDSNFYGQDKT